MTTSPRRISSGVRRHGRPPAVTAAWPQAATGARAALGRRRRCGGQPGPPGPRPRLPAPLATRRGRRSGARATPAAARRACVPARSCVPLRAVGRCPSDRAVAPAPPEEVPHGPGEVVAPLAVVAVPVEATRSPATAARRRPAGPAARPRPRRRPSSRPATHRADGPRTRRRPRRRRRRWPPRPAGGRPTSASGEVEALVPAAGDEHHRVEAPTGRPAWRGARSPWSRRSSARRRRSPTSCDPVGQLRRNSRSASATASTGDAAAARRWPRRPARWRRRGAAPGAARRPPAGRGRRRAEQPRRRPRGSRRRSAGRSATWRPGRRGAGGGRRPGRRALATATSPARWSAQMPRLGRLVAPSEAVHVEVVGGEVQPRRHRRAEAAAAPAGTTTPRPRTPRGRVVDGGHEGHVGVADRRGPPARRPQHRRDQRGHRGLAVGAGDGDDAAGRPTRRPGRAR